MFISTKLNFYFCQGKGLMNKFRVIHFFFLGIQQAKQSYAMKTCSVLFQQFCAQYWSCLIDKRTATSGLDRALVGTYFPCSMMPCLPEFSFQRMPVLKHIKMSLTSKNEVPFDRFESGVV